MAFSLVLGLLVIGGVVFAAWDSRRSTRPDAAAMIYGATDVYLVAPVLARLINVRLTEVLGDERLRELHARGMHMAWDQALAYTIAQATLALREIKKTR